MIFDKEHGEDPCDLELAEDRVRCIEQIEETIEELRELFDPDHPTADDELLRMRRECKALRRWLRDDFAAVES